ncbi:hypothetical protein SISSUDRAFT_1068115 [Sistotremastrum suecicum HHB10207 ss-3]|uniref:Uncharacterized protein n=1 Tax=Sistotremastrum suecicum HHB10207 ss-3 TaxID=1314776 RepID=A0A165WFB9_9AGAM|nr:hypothetical protein SISSUDRAFT_1068115 [Sistotremastrum suecicum HHB10207 ss-3]
MARSSGSSTSSKARSSSSGAKRGNTPALKTRSKAKLDDVVKATSKQTTLALTKTTLATNNSKKRKAPAVDVDSDLEGLTAEELSEVKDDVEANDDASSSEADDDEELEEVSIAEPEKSASSRKKQKVSSNSASLRSASQAAKVIDVDKEPEIVIHIPEKTTSRKESTRDMLTIFSDKVRVKFVKEGPDGSQTSEMLRGRWCMPCK